MGRSLCYAELFGGIGLIALIDRLVPSAENPHEMPNPQDIRSYAKSSSHKKKFLGKSNAGMKARERRILRVGLITALVLFIHNFPEGMVTFLSGLEELQLAIPITVAIAIHNIPEGISVSVPIYYATDNKRLAFWISFLSGLAEPVGGAGISCTSTFPQQYRVWCNICFYSRHYGIYLA